MPGRPGEPGPQPGEGARSRTWSGQCASAQRDRDRVHPALQQIAHLPDDRETLRVRHHYHGRPAAVLEVADWRPEVRPALLEASAVTQEIFAIFGIDRTIAYTSQRHSREKCSGYSLGHLERG